MYDQRPESTLIYEKTLKHMMTHNTDWDPNDIVSIAEGATNVEVGGTLFINKCVLFGFISSLGLYKRHTYLYKVIYHSLERCEGGILFSPSRSVQWL